jgi:hypothetical protein
VFGCGYRRIADHSCSATTLRRRRDEWITAGVAEQLRLAVLAAYDRLLGLEVEHLSVDGCITKAPCGGQVAGPSPVDSRKQGLKRSVATETGGIPLAAIPAPANQRDDGCWLPPWTPSPSLARCPSGPRCTWTPATTSPAGRCWRTGHGRPDRHARRAGTGPGGAPLGDRAHAWANQYGKLRWCTEHRRLVVEFWRALALAVITLGRLIRRALAHCRWEGRPRRRPCACCGYASPAAHPAIAPVWAHRRVTCSVRSGPG